MYTLKYLHLFSKKNHYRDSDLKLEMIKKWKGQHSGVTGNGKAFIPFLKRHQNDKCSQKTYIASRKGHLVQYQVGH